MLIKRVLGFLGESRGAPLLTLYVLWRDGQQFAEGVLGGTDTAARIDNLRLDIDVRCLHLVDSGGISLTVLEERLLRFERGTPKAVSHGQDIQLAIKQL